MAKTVGRLLGVEICQVLGLDAGNVQSLTLRLEAENPLYVDVRLYVTANQELALAELSKRYRVIEAEVPVGQV